jgi:hypothetical protein
VAVHERTDPVLERLLGAAANEQDSEAGDGADLEHLGERDEAGDPGQVVVGSGNGRAAPDVGQEPGRAQREGEARCREPSPSEHGGPQSQEGPPTTAHHCGGPVLIRPTRSGARS